MKELKEILNDVCHTSERTFDGTIYTFADVRFPEYNDKKMFVSLEYGEYKYQWLDEKIGD